MRLLHVRPAAGPPRRRRTSRPSRCCASPADGARQGCHEALFTLGERPEERYAVARDWLREHGYDSTVHYLHAMAKLVLDETGLLPHANAGALYEDELRLLAEVSPSQGMMLETLRDDLPCHRGAPDKVPARRLATLEDGRPTGHPVHHRHPRRHRREPAGPHRRAARPSPSRTLQHGHVQEVIVQNFLPKPGTGMQHEPPCPEDEYLWSIAAARVLLPPEIHLQAPPNLSDEFGVLLDAGIDDWGGVSPVTLDHVNPERPWPALDRLREVTEAKGFALAPRLTIYPEFVREPERWLHPSLRFPVMDRSDAECLGRDDPGAVWPEKVTAADVVLDGAEVVLVGSPLHAVVLGRHPAAAHAAAGAASAVRARSGARGARRRGRRAGGRASSRSSRCSVPAGPRWRRWPSWPTNCAATPWATPSPGCTTATSTTPTCARSSASSAASRRARCR